MILETGKLPKMPFSWGKEVLCESGPGWNHQRLGVNSPGGAAGRGTDADAGGKSLCSFTLHASVFSVKIKVRSGAGSEPGVRGC